VRELIKKPIAKWIGGTGAASIVALVYIHGFIFPRTEAVALIKRVDRIEERVEKRLEKIDTKLDQLLLLRRGSKKPRPRSLVRIPSGRRLYEPVGPRSGNRRR